MSLRQNMMILTAIGISILIFWSINEVLKNKSVLTNEKLTFNNTKRQDTLVIIPTITAMAYEKNGFYDYYNKKCDEKCLSIKIHEPKYDFASSITGIIRLTGQMNYESISDVKLHEKLILDEHYLNKYPKIIVLHNEYVTKQVFTALVNHNKTIFLYPNALYAEVEITDDIIRLVRGHGYPEAEISNGFGWIFDNSKLEYDRKCENVRFYEIQNGLMLNCYPENIIQDDVFLGVLDGL